MTASGRSILAGACVVLAGGGCANAPGTTQEWAATGFHGAGGAPIAVGVFATERACEDAAADWRARQVVGTAVSTECLPLSRY
ncbi:MAG: hypothetical protein AAGC56_04905 [Pseudomonadota bacterium]